MLRGELHDLGCMRATTCLERREPSTRLRVQRHRLLNVPHARWLGATAFAASFSGCVANGTTCAADAECEAPGSCRCVRHSSTATSFPYAFDRSSVTALASQR